MPANLNVRAFASLYLSAAKPSILFIIWGVIEVRSAGVHERCEIPKLEAFAGPMGAPCGRPSVLTLQENVVSYLCVLRRDYSMFYQTQPLLYNSRSELRRGRLDNLDVDGMSNKSFDAMGVAMMKSTYNH